MSTPLPLPTRLKPTAASNSTRRMIYEGERSQGVAVKPRRARTR
jgi:hypothetical protein